MKKKVNIGDILISKADGMRGLKLNQKVICTKYYISAGQSTGLIYIDNNRSPIPINFFWTLSELRKIKLQEINAI